MKILFLSRWFPYPINNGSKLRIYHLLRGLSEYHDLTLLSFVDQPDLDLDALEIQSLCKEIRTVPWHPFDPQGWRARLGFFSMRPRSVIDTFSIEMEEQINQALSRQNYDLVIASQIDMAAYSHIFRHLPNLLEEIELGLPYERFSQAKTILARLRHGLTWLKQRHYLGRLLGDFSGCTVVSEQEQQLLVNQIPNIKLVEVIPNCINLTDYSEVNEIPQPNQVIFTGSFRYWANHDAMVWFLQEIYPQVQAKIADVQLTITGDHANLPLPSTNNVRLTGFVDDVRPLIATAWVSVVPLRVGGGTRLKILEAMALGTPVVTTSKGAEGLKVKNGTHLLIADTPQMFADTLLRLLEDPILRQRLVDNALQFVRHHYDWTVVMPRFLSLVERTARVQH
jgi:glycosyltransferase involved in cell wall biosynthesis